MQPRKPRRFYLFFRLLVLIAIVVAAWTFLSGNFPVDLSLVWPESFGIPPQLPVYAVQGKTVGVIAGHMNYDTGAVCPDGLQETTITQAVTRLVAERLSAAGVTVEILGEKDARLQGYKADALLSIHADSCIDLSGYKAARSLRSTQPLTEDKFLRCIYKYYGHASGLPQHLSTISHNMTEYYAFDQLDDSTPAVILELGFLGGDRPVLTEHQDRLGWGIADGILCFLQDQVK